jgi:RNA polymerase sigma-70 factor (ECF subfamily)
MQLLEAWRRGDGDALAQLLQAYHRRIYAVCHRMLHDAEEAADLAHDALVKVVEGLERYDGRSKLSTWIIRVTMNACLSHLRKERLRRHASLDEPAPGEGQSRGQKLPARGELPALEHVERAEMHGLLLHALAAIEPQLRAVLVLRDVQDLSYDQIAQVIDAPIGTVKSRLFRAREALRTALEGAAAAPRRVGLWPMTLPDQA